MDRAEENAGVLYAVFPGVVTSKNDGGMHFVGPRQLMELYGVPPFQCVVVEYGKNVKREIGGLIPLFPRYDGDYSVARIIQDMPWE